MTKDLFELIKAMTPTEKRYFRVQTSKKSEETGDPQATNIATSPYLTEFCPWTDGTKRL
jgi:hypothetical protein